MRRYLPVLAVAAAGLITFSALGATSAPPSRADLHRGPAVVASSAPDLAPLTAMTAPLKSVGHNVVMTTKISKLISAVNPPAKMASATVTGNGIQIDEVVANGKIYVRANLGANLNKQIGITPNVWTSIDTSQINATNELLIQASAADPVDLTGISAGVNSLKVVDAQHITGTIDLTKITGSTRPDAEEVTKAGAAGRHAPFTATADSSGRIVGFTVNTATINPDLALNVVYADYGAPAAITVPTGAVPAPKAMYTIFNS